MVTERFAEFQFNLRRCVLQILSQIGRVVLPSRERTHTMRFWDSIPDAVFEISQLKRRRRRGCNVMWFKKKLMPDLPIYNGVAESDLPELSLRKLPAVANEIANVLAKENLDFRNSVAALSHVLGWFAFQIKQNGHDPEEFMSNVTKQSLNYCEEFSRHYGSKE
jgi:hypothetical protein